MNAILLAAGMGTRLLPLTKTTPKSLTMVNGEPLIERQIKFLKEIGIEEIIIVTGYLHEKFSYLKEKYNVTLIHNEKYAEYNNIYSMYLVREYLPNSYVIDADNYLSRNFLLKNPQTSMYLSVKRPFQNEWVIRTNGNKLVTEIIEKEQGNDFILSGVSYWSKQDGELIVRKIEEKVENGQFKDLYWDNIVKDNIVKLNVYLYELQEGDIYEIDTISDLEKVKNIVEKC